jgi:hypothetical protein
LPDNFDLEDRLRQCLLRQEVEDIGDDFFVESPLTSCASSPASSPRSKYAELPDSYGCVDPPDATSDKDAEPCTLKRKYGWTKEIDTLDSDLHKIGVCPKLLKTF